MDTSDQFPVAENQAVPTPRASAKDQTLKLVGALLLLLAGAGGLAYRVTHLMTENEANRPFALLSAQDQDDATDFTLMTADGGSVTLAQALKKGPVVLDYWATWCGPCREEMPKLEAVSNAYAARGVQFYGVNIDAKAERVTQYARKYGLTFPQIIGVNSGVDEMFQVGSYPTTLVIDTHAKIRARNEGSDPDFTQDLSKTLDVLLKK